MNSKTSRISILAKEHSEVVSAGNKEKFERAIKTKNPLALSTFEERGASIEAKLDRIRSNKKYQSMTPEQQSHIRSNMYNKYVAPSYQQFHLPVPSKEEWVRMTTHDTNKIGNRTGANTYADSNLEYAVTRGFIQGDKAASGIALFGARVANKTFQKLHGIDNIFSAHLPQAAPNIPKSDFVNRGNIDIYNRPVVANPTKDDPTRSSTVLSKSFNFDGKEVLIPTVSDGADGKPPHLMNDHEAIAYYRKTGQYLGKFDTVAEADAYGEKLHEQQAGLKNRNGRTYDPSREQQTAPKEDQGKVQKFLNRVANHAKAHIESDNFWLQTHPRDTLLGDLGGLTGEVIATLPLYEAIGGNLKSVAAPLTKKLATTAVGRYVGKTLIAATDGYLSSLVVSGGDKSEAKVGAAIGAAIPAVGAVAGKVASNSLIKKWTASVLSMGGKPFAQDLAASAHHQELAVIEHLEDATQHKQGNTINFGHGVSITHTGENTGHISFAGVDHEYKSVTERQSVYKKVETLSQQAREEYDPINHKLHEAEKRSQNSIAQQLYGKPLSGLSKAQRTRVLGKRLQLIDEAALEAPVHLPEVQKAEVEHQIADQVAVEPELGSWFDKIQKEHGSSVADAVTNNTIRSVANDTGIQDVKAVKANIEKPLNKSKLADRFVSFGPKDLAELRTGMVSYFKNPHKERLAADGTKIGSRDKRAWNEILKSDNLKEFIETLKEADGGKIKFESPDKHMLFHWSNRSSFTPELKNKFLREMRKIKGQENLTTKQFDNLADWNLVHLNEMAKSGKLVSEKNIYASTKLGAPFNPNGEPFWTKYQFQLAEDNDKDQLHLIEQQLKRHPKVLQGVKAGISILSDAKYNTQSPEEFLALDKMFRDRVETIQLGINKKHGWIGFKGEE